MDSYLSLALTFWVLCIYETVISTDISAIVFSTFFFLKRGFRFSETLFRLNGRGYFIANLFMPVDIAFACSDIPISISPRGIVSSGGEVLGYDQIKSVTADERYLYIDGRRWCRSGGAQTGDQIVTLLTALRSATEDLREGIIGDFLAKRLDAQRAKALASDFFRRSAVLRRLSSMFFLYTIAVLLNLTRTNLMKQFWPLLLAVYLFFVAAIMFLYYRCDRHFRGRTSAGRLGNMLLMVAFPPYLVKAGGLLGEKLFHSFHPVAFAKAFLSEKSFTGFAGEYYRRLKFGRSAAHSEISGEIGEWFRKYHITCIDRFFEDIGFDAAAFTAKPEAENDKIRGYCPRCLAQYTLYPGECSDCRISLNRIDPASKSSDD